MSSDNVETKAICSQSVRTSISYSNTHDMCVCMQTHTRTLPYIEASQKMRVIMHAQCDQVTTTAYNTILTSRHVPSLTFCTSAASIDGL